MTSNGGMIITFGAWTLAAALFTTRGDRAAANGTYYLADSINLTQWIYFSAVIAMIPLFYLTYSIAYTPMLVAYTVEILPFGIRARGFALMVRSPSIPCCQWAILLGTTDAEVPVEFCHLYRDNHQSICQSHCDRKTGLEIRKFILPFRSS